MAASVSSASAGSVSSLDVDWVRRSLIAPSTGALAQVESADGDDVPHVALELACADDAERVSEALLRELRSDGVQQVTGPESSLHQNSLLASVRVEGACDADERRLVVAHQSQVGVDPRDVFHPVDVAHVAFHVPAVLFIETRQVIAADFLVVQIAV